MSGPSTDAVMAVRVAVRSAIADLPEGSTLLVGCSGGADSLSLAAATVWVGQRARLRIGAVTVDHGLAGGSDVVAASTVEACGALGLDPVIVRRVDASAKPGGEGPEAAARHARRAALLDEANRYGAAAVLLGHTLDDQAETVLLGLARGSGARSLAGMRAVTGVFRRPLLAVPRSVVRQAAADLGLVTFDDPHNSDPRFTRSRVRHETLPVLERTLGPGVAEALARSADLLRDDADALDDIAAQHRRELGDQPELTALAALPMAIRTRIIRAIAIAAGAPADSMGRDQVMAVDRLVTNPRVRGPIHLPGGCIARREYGRLQIAAVDQ